MICLICQAGAGLSERVNGQTEEITEETADAPQFESSDGQGHALTYLWFGGVIVLLGVLAYLIWRQQTHAPGAILVGAPTPGWFEVHKLGDKGESIKLGEGAIPGTLKVSAGEYEVWLEGGADTIVREHVTVKAGETRLVPDIDELKMQANAAGSPESERTLGFLYLYGWKVNEDDAAAFRLLERAASEGDLDAAVGAGDAWWNGEGTPFAGVQADKWYSLAASRGSSEAMERKGLITGNKQEALRLFRESSDLRNPHGDYWLGERYELSYNYDVALGLYQRVLEDASKGDAVIALTELRIGELQYRGWLGSVNIKEALEWFKKAAQDPYASSDTAGLAAFWVSTIYKENPSLQDGNGNDAMTWLKKSGEGGCAFACQQLYNMHLTGNKADDDHWLQLALKASDKINKRAQTHEYQLHF